MILIFATGVEPAVAEALPAETMIIGIIVAVAVIFLTNLISRIRTSHKSDSLLAQAMVGVPEIHSLSAVDKEGAIRELVDLASLIVRMPDKTSMLQGVMRREAEMSTGLANGVAVPHARFLRLNRSLVLMGRSEKGIDWECLDDRPANLVFLVLTAEDHQHDQLQILSELGFCASDDECLDAFKNAKDCRTIVKTIEDRRKKNMHIKQDG